MRPVALLSWWKLRNSLRTLLSDPRKLIPFAFIAVVLGCGFVPILLVRSMPRASALTQIVDPTLVHAALSMAMVLVGLTILNTGLGDNLLAFAMPDVDYLFPSPISRRVVLGYRLPSLTAAAVFSVGIIVVMFSAFTGMIGLVVPKMGNTVSPAWLGLATVGICVGIYLNLALFVAVQFKNRNLSHRILTAGILMLLGGLGLVAWQLGIPAATKIVESPWLGWTLLPSRLATDALFAIFCHEPAGGPVMWLVFGYALSVIPLMVTKANYYEASIVSTERVATMRQAAKGGYASLMAAKAAQSKYKSLRPYTVRPFGQGAVALFWAHLCAASKKWFATFVSPAIGGVIVGVAGAMVNHVQKGLGYGVIAFSAFYASIIFMTGGKTASEAAIRRRELISPLPIRAWKAVAAILGVPMLVYFILCVSTSFCYAIDGGREWTRVVFAFVLFVRLRM